MLRNRSAPAARVAPVLIVADVRAAVAWYGAVFGVVEHVRIGEGHRAQLGVPGDDRAEFIVAEQRPGGRRAPLAESRSHQIMLKVDDVKGLVDVAAAHGAVVVDPVRDWEYGERQATLADPFGHHWVLTQTLVDVDPTAWGGTTVTPRR